MNNIIIDIDKVNDDVMCDLMRVFIDVDNYYKKNVGCVNEEIVRVLNEVKEECDKRGVSC